MLSLPRANLQQILVGSITPLARGALRSQDGDLANGIGAVTASVYSLAGVLSGAAGRTTATTGTGLYTVPLTTVEASTLNIWRVDWLDGGVKRAETYHGIVGGFMFSRAELQAMPGVGATYSTDVLDATRDWITNLIEQQTGAAWCPRYDVDQFVARGWTSHACDYRPIRAVRSITVNSGTVIDPTTAVVNAEAGTIGGIGILGSVVFFGLCEVGYEHGYDSPPETLRQAALVAAADLLNRAGSGLSERTRAVTNDLGVVQQFSYPGLDHPTGIDFVDRAIMDNDQRLPQFG